MQSMLDNTLLNYAPHRKFNEDDFLGNSQRHISTVYSLFSPTVGVKLSGLATTAVRLFTARNTACVFGCTFYSVDRAALHIVRYCIWRCCTVHVVRQITSLHQLLGRFRYRTVHGVRLMTQLPCDKIERDVALYSTCCQPHVADAHVIRQMALLHLLLDRRLCCTY